MRSQRSSCGKTWEWPNCCGGANGGAWLGGNGASIETALLYVVMVDGPGLLVAVLEVAVVEGEGEDPSEGRNRLDFSFSC
jgi:hypothetical protein